MAGVDDRVVSMQFDNAQFEQRLGDTLKGLDQLNKSLDFSNAQRNLGGLSDAGNRFNMGNMAGAVEGVSTKFLALATIGITTLANITNRAVDAGIQLVKSLSVDQISAGFSDYNEKLTSVQTIMNATGKDINTVSGYFGQLDTYSDKTIYNLKDMTGAFAKFTNAGLDMKVSVPAIKGIANMVALAGQGADAASIAMYNLSQSLAGGFLTTMDYKSLNLANVATKEWKDQMIAGAVAAGTLKKGVDGTYQTLQDDKSFKGAYTDAALFTEGLKDQWATSKVLTDVLGKYGDETTAIGKKALAAAQNVKSLPMMMDTLKASVGTGWTTTFETILGNVDQSTKLFTDLTTGIQKHLDNISNARNDLLAGWAKGGGRDKLIEGFKDGIKALGAVLTTVKTEFRTFFPAKTSADLISMTENFAQFTKNLMPTRETLHKLSLIFDGLFSIVDIGWHILKELAWAIGNLIGNFRGAGGGALTMAANVGQLLLKLDEWLIVGGHLHDFFLKIDHVVDIASTAIKKAYDVIFTFFKNIFAPVEVSNKILHDFDGTMTHSKGLVEQTGDALDRFKQRWEELAGAGKKLEAFGEGVVHTLEKVWGYISKWFSELGQKLAEAIKPGDFDVAVDAVNVGLLGGIVLMLKKFFKGGAHVDLDFTGGIFDKAGGAIDAFKDKMKAVQTELKAKALMEIAIALGVLTASIVVLSLIDSAKLTKAMTALAIGMAQLVGVMKLMDTIASDTKDAAKFTILAVGLTLVASATLILSGAVALLAQLSWEDLAKGLLGVTALLGLMVATAKLMEGSAITMLAMGVAMIPFAAGLVILAGAVALFGLLSWADLLKGLVGLAAALTIVVVAVNAMPIFATLAAGKAMIPLAAGIVILAGAIKIFSMMSWEEMAKGMVGLAGVLLLVATAVNFMPITLPFIGRGLVLVAEAIGLMMIPLELLAHMKWGDMLKGLGGLAAMLGILAGGLYLMSGTLLGAAALVVAAGALTILARVLVTIGGMSIKELVIGLVGIAAAIGVIAGMAVGLSEAIPFIFLLGVALGAVGVAFTLFGAGAWMVAKAFQTMAVAGTAGVKAMMEAMEIMIGGLPRLIKALLTALTDSASAILKSADLLLRMITVLLLQILETVIKLVPSIARAIGEIIDAGVLLLLTKGPMLIATGFILLMMFLSAMKDHIDEVAQTAFSILIKFINTLTNNTPILVDKAVDLLLAFLGAIANRLDDVNAAGVNLLLSFLAGMINNLYRLVDFAVTVIITLAQTIANETERIIVAGTNILLNFIAGMINNLYRVINFAVSVIITMAQTIGNETGRIIDAGANILVKFVEGVARDIWKVAHKGTDIVIAFLEAIGGEGVRLARGAAQALIDFLNGLSRAIDEQAPEIRKAAVKLAEAIVGGITGGLLDPRNIGNVVDAAKGMVQKGFQGAKDWLLSRSPSKRFMQLGKSMAQGVAVALDSDTLAEHSAVKQAERIVKAFHETISQIPDSLSEMDATSPVITPVLDLTKVKMGAKNMGQLLVDHKVAPQVSFGQARDIATTTDLAAQAAPEQPSISTTEVTLNQNIYSPTPLSTNEIYKKTNSALAKTKKELDI